MVGFTAVILLLVAAAVVGVNNARSIARNSAELVSDQLVITRLMDEVEREQEVLNAAFYRLIRTPESVDRANVLADLNQTDENIAQLVAASRHRARPADLGEFGSRRARFLHRGAQPFG